MELQNYFVLCHELPDKGSVSPYLNNRAGNAFGQNNFKNLFGLYWLSNVYVISEHPESIINDFPVTFSNKQMFVGKPTVARVKAICDKIAERNSRASITICYLNNMVPDFAHLKSSLTSAKKISRYYPVLLTLGEQKKEIDLTYGYFKYNQATNHSAKEVSTYYPSTALNGLTIKYDNDIICNSGVITANAITLGRNLKELHDKYHDHLSDLSILSLLENASNIYVLPTTCNWYSIFKPKNTEAKTVQLKVA